MDFNGANRGEEADRRVEASDHVGGGQWRQTGRRVGEPVQIGKSGHRLDQGSKTRFVAVRPRLSPPGQTYDHKLAIHREQSLGRETHSFKSAGHEVLDKRIGRLNELADNLSIVVAVQVKRYAALAARIGLPKDLAVLHSPTSEIVTALRVLNFDDIGAEIRKNVGNHVACDEAR